tara:strand:- start:135 stop:518 length:384 start_codon:yes stop_codon:yes gene_type:complete
MSTSKTVGVRFTLDEYEKIENYYKRKDKPFKSLSDAVREIVEHGLTSENEIVISKSHGLTKPADAVVSFCCSAILSVCLLGFIALPQAMQLVKVQAIFAVFLGFFWCYFMYNFFFVIYQLKQYEQSK